MINKLKLRFIFITMFLISVVLIIMFSIIILSSSSHMREESFENLDKEYTMFSTIENDNSPGAQDIAQGNLDQPFAERSPFYTFFVVLDENNKITELFDITGQVAMETAENVADTVIKQDIDIGSLSEYNLRFNIYNSDSHKIIGFIDYSYEAALLRRQIISYVFVFVAALTVFMVISVILSNIAVNPISTAWKKQQQFISDASHELRTPLSVMLANTSILLNDETLGKEHLKWVDNLDGEAKHMKKLVEELLFLAQIDSKKDKVLFKNISLSNVVLESSLAFESLIFDSGRNLMINVNADIDLYGNENHIKRLVNILLDNAMKYSHVKTNITISLKKENDKAILTVHNFGEPINKDLSSYIFDRFYMISNARTRNSDGYGLGLALAKEIVDLHNGKISVSSSIDEGTYFSVKF